MSLFHVFIFKFSSKSVIFIYLVNKTLVAPINCMMRCYNEIAAGNNQDNLFTHFEQSGCKLCIY